MLSLNGVCLSVNWLRFVYDNFDESSAISNRYHHTGAVSVRLTGDDWCRLPPRRSGDARGGSLTAKSHSLTLSNLTAARSGRQRDSYIKRRSETRNITTTGLPFHSLALISLVCKITRYIRRLYCVSCKPKPYQKDANNSDILDVD